MRIEIDTRRVVPIAVIALIALVAIAVLIWRAQTEARAVVSWSGTISSAAPTSTSEFEPQRPVVTIEPAPEDLEIELNRYWLRKINELREEKGLRVLRFDDRLAATAEAWANEMASRREVTHARVDGKTMHQWIDTKGLPFAERGEHGWKTNYFVENIARFYAQPTTEDMQRALDEILGWFLAEGPGGDHYESIYHPDWNSVGMGYAVNPTEEQRRAYFVFHYGRLQ